MSQLTFKKKERLTADKMNALASQAASGSSNYGGVRSSGGVTPNAVRDRTLPRSLFCYEATADATWNSTDASDEHWEVTVKKVNQDGTLGTTEYTKRAIGIETGETPITSGQRCVETVTGDGRRVVVTVPAETHLPFDIRANQTTGNIEFYATSDGTITTDMAYLNGQELAWADEPTPTGIDETGWVELTTLPSTGTTKTVYFRLDVDSALATDADMTTATAMQWVISTTSASPLHGYYKQRVIATVNNTDGVYTVTQFLRGSQSINARYTDNESKDQLGSNDLYDTRSITTQVASGSGSLTLYRFAAGSVPTGGDWTQFKFLIREIATGDIKQLSYYPGSSFQTEIQSLIDTAIGNIPDPQPPESGDPYEVDWRDWWDYVWDEIAAHSNLPDLVAGTGTDEHRNSARGGTGSNVSYLNLDGNETRNSMAAAAYIGDASNAKSIWPSGRQLMNGATVVVDWILRKLSGGAWTITDTTEATGTAGTTAGALVVDGGVNIKDNLIVQDTTAASYTGSGSGAIKATGGIYAADGIAAKNATTTWCAAFNDTAIGAVALLAGTYGGQFYTTFDDGVTLSDGTYGVNAGLVNAAVAYYHNGVQGADVTNWTGGGIVTGTDIIEIDASDLRPTDKILVRR